MSTTRLASVLGLGFGDCGKGLFTDYLCRQWNAHTVVRFNGGAQAGHNVVLPDGRHHTFAQFGAGTFMPGVATILSQPVVVHPTALLVEAEHLRQSGVPDCLQRILIDARCRITTPFHQAGGRLRELRRGTGAHGSCGAGVGETVRHGLAHPAHILTYQDLAQPTTALAKLEEIRRTFLAEFDDAAEAAGTAAQEAEMRILRDETISQRWLDVAVTLLATAPPASIDQLSERLNRPGAAIFEGAQGVLLDEWHGFHPHTTWSSIGTAAVDAVARDLGQAAPIRHFGAIRSYLTRHGAGPLPTEDAALDDLPEPHNQSDGWQGTFRRGHPDAVLLRYALSVVDRLDGLLVSHLDAVATCGKLKWCDAYQVDAGSIASLQPGAPGDLEHQSALTRLLSGARPVYDAAPIPDAQTLVRKIEEAARLPVLLGSHGPHFEAVSTLADIGPASDP